MRNTFTRPVSWKISESEQLKKAIDRGGFLAESLFIRMLTSRDNLGRMMANKDFLRGFLYPKQAIEVNEIARVRDILADEGLIIYYLVNGVEYLLFPKIADYSRLVGNMSIDSQIPPPPDEVVRSWEARFNDVYTPLEHRSNATDTAYERRMNGVHTPYKRCSNGVCTEGEGEVEGEREGEGERERVKKSPSKAVQVKKLTPVQVFVGGFEKTYEALSGHKYKHSNKDFITATRLIKDFGMDEVIEKAKILAVLCQRGKTWFAKDGFSDFTIGNLSAQWNKILPQTKLTPEEIKNQEFLKKLKEEAARYDRVSREINRK